MHIPDGFFDAPTSIVAGIVAIGLVALCLRMSARTLDDRQIPLCGLAAAFVFAVQMLNFPVASGTSGHLLGGVLAAVLVGPWAGALCVTVVLAVQALLFADGGLSALGLNVINMAMIGAFAGYVIFVAIRTVAAVDTIRRRVRVGHRRVRGTGARRGGVHVRVRDRRQRCGTRRRTVGWAMIGVHLLIGIGEGIITALTVSAVMSSRPDLVYGARNLTFDPVPIGDPVGV